jgi:hypothetical protein
MSNPWARAASVVLSCLLGLAPWRAAGADAPRLAGEAGRAFQAFDAAAERLQRARAAMSAIEAREAPRGSAGDWANVVSAAESAAEALRKAELPAVPDTAEYTVSQDQLRSCATRGGALARVDRLYRTLQTEGQRFGELKGYLRERQAQAQEAEANRVSLLKSMARASDDSRVAEYFTWHWSGLERPLAGAIASYLNDLRRWLERVDRAQGEVRARANALNGLASDWSRQRDCVLAGRWVGVKTLEGAVSGVTLKLASSGNTWTGTVAVNGVEEQVRSVALKGNAVHIVIGDRRTSLTGTLSGDEKMLKGTMSSIDGPAPFTLKKQ